MSCCACTTKRIAKWQREIKFERFFWGEGTLPSRKTIFSAEKYYLHHVRGCSSTLRLGSLFCFLEEISSAFEGQFTSEWSMSKLRLRIVGLQASANMVKYTGVF